MSVISFNCSVAHDVWGEDGLLFPVTGVRILAVELVQLYRTESMMRAAMPDALLDRLKTHYLSGCASCFLAPAI